MEEIKIPNVSQLEEIYNLIDNPLWDLSEKKKSKADRIINRINDKFYDSTNEDNFVIDIIDYDGDLISNYGDYKQDYCGLLISLLRPGF